MLLMAQELRKGPSQTARFGRPTLPLQLYDMARQCNANLTWSLRNASNDIINCQVPDLKNPFNRYTLLMSDTGVLVTWLQNNGLLVTDLNCVACEQPCISELLVPMRKRKHFVKVTIMCGKFTLSLIS